jgi:hypothetical protein
VLGIEPHAVIGPKGQIALLFQSRPTIPPAIPIPVDLGIRPHPA